MKRAAASAGLAAVLAAGPSWANGAFPDSTQIVLPRDRPDEIVAGTNFGLLISRDAGATWSWVCEEAIGPMTVLYQIGAPPADTLFALAQTGLLSSSDRACTWAVAPPPLDDNGLRDVFPDATDARRVFALTASALFESRDGGRTFGPPLHQPGGGLELSGVEAAASDPRVVYVTRFANRGADGITASIARSDDGGRSFRAFDLRPQVGEGFLRLAAVDPTEPRRVYLRMTTGHGDRLVVSDDGGETARVALAFSGAMAAFLRRADGTLLVTSADEGAFVSRDGGVTFAPWTGAPRLRGLGERDGVLYGAADNARDGFVVGASRDGVAWRPLLRMDQLCGVLACSPRVADACAAPWQRLRAQFDIPEHACAAPATSDAGAGAAPASGCACAASAPRTARGPAPWLLVALGALGARRRLSSTPGRPRRWPRGAASGAPAARSRRRA